MNLTNYQKECVTKGLSLLSRGQPFLIADEMGLGKSREALAIADRRVEITGEENAKILILCPAFLMDNWGEELEKCGLHKKYNVVLIRNKNFPVAKEKGYTIFIVGYSLFSSMSHEGEPNRVHTQFRVHGSFLTIVDECHYLKNPKANRTLSVYSNNGIFNHSKNFIALSGTPIPNSIIEIWPLFFYFTKNLDVSHRKYWEFAHYYCAAFKTRYGMDVSGASHVEELSAILKTFSIRRLKKDVLKELPDKLKKIVIVAQDSKIKNAIVEEKLIWDLHKDSLLSQQNINKKIPGLPEMRKKLGVLKVPFCIEYVGHIIKTSNLDKVLIFCHHREVVDTLRQGLSHYNSYVIDGRVDVNKRQDIVSIFNKAKETSVLICNMKAGGVGFNITSCNQVIILEPSWVIGENEQAEDRCHRKGQTDVVTIHYLLVKDSLDYNIVKALTKKNKNIKGVI